MNTILHPHVVAFITTYTDHSGWKLIMITYTVIYVYNEPVNLNHKLNCLQFSDQWITLPMQRWEAIHDFIETYKDVLPKATKHVLIKLILALNQDTQLVEDV